MVMRGFALGVIWLVGVQMPTDLMERFGTGVFIIRAVEDATAEEMVVR